MSETTLEIKFSDFGLQPELLEAISYMGFKSPTPIQQQAIPLINSGKDLIACAQTGTGKTGAFLLPLLSRIMSDASNPGTKALIVVPTRELAIQIDQQIEGMAFGAGITSIAIYGGGDGDNWVQQKKALTEGVDIVVATPGKLISHLNLGYVKFNEVKYLVLDEADRMLDIGFHDDVLKILGFLNAQRQTLMFSATMPPKIRAFAKIILKEPEEISLAVSKPADGVAQSGYLVFDDNKEKLIRKIISDRQHYDSIIVFSSTKANVHKIVRTLKRIADATEGISSDLEQSEREEVLNRFRNKRTRILVATDVVSRGIDIKDINLVINYNVPKDPEDYVHRIGRTARASTSGEAITLINPEEMGSFARIEKLIEKQIEKHNTHEDIGLSPEWNPNFRGQGGRPNGSKPRHNGNRNGNKPKKGPHRPA